MTQLNFNRIKQNSDLVLNSSATVSAPVLVKSWGRKLVTGAPTGAVPRMSEPVIRTSSTGAAAGAAAGWAWAAWLHASERKDAVPRSRAALADL